MAHIKNRQLNSAGRAAPETVGVYFFDTKQLHYVNSVAISNWHDTSVIPTALATKGGVYVTHTWQPQGLLRGNANVQFKLGTGVGKAACLTPVFNVAVMDGVNHVVLGLDCLKFWGKKLAVDYVSKKWSLRPRRLWEAVFKQMQ